jgi:two-component system phosphate regulon sensor histidine kinase PhoR
LLKAKYSGLFKIFLFFTMRKRSIALIIGLMSFALLGVITMQLYFLNQSYQLQSELFDRSVNEALNNVVAKVTRHDALNFLNAKTRLRNKTNSAMKSNALDNNSNVENHIAKSLSKKKLSYRQKKLAILRDSLRKLILNKKMDDEFDRLTQGGKFDLQFRFEEFTDELGITHQRITPELVKIPPYSQKRKLHKYDTVRYIYSDPQFGKQIISVPHINAEWARVQDSKIKESQLN